MSSDFARLIQVFSAGRLGAILVPRRYCIINLPDFPRSVLKPPRHGHRNTAKQTNSIL